MLGLGLSINQQRVMGGPAVPPPTINSVAIDNTAPTVGDTLTASVDATDADSITYQWKADGVNIGGETAQTYLTTRAGAMGRAITVTAIAHKTGAANSAPMTSSATALVTGAPVNEAAPVATTDGANAPSGPAVATVDTLSTTDGTWSGYPAPIITYQWRNSDGVVPGETAATHATVSDDAFHSPFSCRVTGTNSAAAVDADSNSVAITQP